MIENQNDSLVSLGICEGLSGFIRTNNKTMLLEPIGKDSAHLLYPLMLNPGIQLQYDQMFDIGRKKRSVSDQIDYDEEGNEIVDTIRSEELEDYSQTVDEDEDEDSELSNSIDEDDVVISDVYSEIEDYDVHPPPVITEAKTQQEAEENSSVNNQTRLDNQDTVDIDGFSVDNLWEGKFMPLKFNKSHPICYL